MESQKKLLAAQTNALAVQTAPPLACFTGEEVEVEEKSFGRWLDRFEERATLLTWSDDQKVYQLKVHLTKTAAQVYQLLTPEQRGNYGELVKALKARFKPVDIEELRGLEFHQLMQTDESVEKLGLQLMQLARKAFPSLGEKELDRLLKGRFFQAVLPKWQRKLAAPKVDETFHQLYERARIAERHDKQYQASVGRSNKPKDRSVTTQVKPDAESPQDTTKSRWIPQSSLKCFHCGKQGHFKRSCPERVDRSEAPGKSSSQGESKTATVVGETAAQGVSDKGGDTVTSLSDEQLEEILASRRCQSEQGLLNSSGQVSAVTAQGPTAAMGATLELDVKIEGVEVTAMVDTGAQSSIISRSVLHRIGGHLKRQGKPVPQLQPASLRLFGKDGKAGKHELRVTAQVTLRVEADGVSVPVLLFVQPESTQPCLIGMSAAPALGLKFLNAKGQPLRQAALPAARNPSVVSLIHGKAVPARATSFVEAEVEAQLLKGACVVFDPYPKSLEVHGLGATESLLRVNAQGKVFIPMVNYNQSVIHLDKGTKLGFIEVVCEQALTDAAELDHNGEDEAAGSEQKLEVGDGDEESVNGGMLRDVEGLQAGGSNVAAVSGESSSRSERLLESMEWPEDLEEDQLEQLKQLVGEFDDIFALDGDDLGCTDVVKHKIDTGDSPPIKQYPRRTPFVQRAKIASMISDMEKKGVVRPSISPWASPVVLVPKKDGSTRFCVDYRRLNAVTKKDVYPLPRIEDILDTIGRAKS